MKGNNNKYISSHKRDACGSGVLVEDCDKVTTESNNIVTPPFILQGNYYPNYPCDWGCDGIRYAVSANNIVKCNLVQDKCDAILFLGPNAGTTFESNEMQNTFRGVYLGQTNIGYQGSPANSQDNKWTGTGFLNKIESSGSPAATNGFYLNPNNSTDLIPQASEISDNGIGQNFPFLDISSAGNITGCNIPLPIEPNVIFTDMMYDDDGNPGNVNPKEKLNREAFYKMIKDDPSLITNTDIQNFKDSMEQEQLGKIDEIKRDLIFPLNAVKYWYETNRTGALAPLDEIESLYKEVLLISLSDSWLYKEVFTQSQIDKLREIALMCPLEKGRAVYAARVLLSYVDMPYVDYRNECENVPAPEHSSARKANNTQNMNIEMQLNTNFSEFNLVPNPNNGQFTISYPRLKEFNLVLKITDIAGQELDKVNLTSEKQSFEYKNKIIAKGMYYYTIVADGKVIFTDKFIVIN